METIIEEPLKGLLQGSIPPFKGTLKGTQRAQSPSGAESPMQPRGCSDALQGGHLRWARAQGISRGSVGA